MNMLKYSKPVVEQRNVFVPITESPTRFYLNEIIIDTKAKQLILCVARCASPDDWPIQMFDLKEHPDELDGKNVMRLQDLSNALVYTHRPSEHSYPDIPCCHPTIEVGIFDNRRLKNGELFFDPYRYVLYVGYDNLRHCIKCSPDQPQQRTLPVR